jgi:hypothetical protein
MPLTKRFSLVTLGTIERKRVKDAQTTHEAIASDGRRLPGAIRGLDGNEHCREPLSDHLDQADQAERAQVT